MHVGRMRMGVPDPAMLMRMRVRLAGRIVGRVLVLMVRVVPMQMRVRHTRVDMLVLVPLRHV